MKAQTTASKDSLRLRELVFSKRDDLYAIMSKYGATELSIFGSVAKGTANQNSDLDLLVDKIETPGLFAMAEFILDLQDTLNTKIDLVESEQIKPNRKESILGGAVIRL